MNEQGTSDPWTYEAVPSSAIRLYRMAWQLETWLRMMVYVELRAARKDWEESIKKITGNGQSSKLNDKKLHHMGTPHEAALSYMTFGQLWALISEPANWPLFEPFFPPKENTSVRVDEVKAIRNRVAHFREPNSTDENRLKLFLADMESGIRRFCVRYTSGTIVTDPNQDPVSAELEKVWPNIGYGIELWRPDGGWLYAQGRHRLAPLMNARLQIMSRTNRKVGSLEGVIYKLTFSRNTNGKFDNVSFFESTQGLHKDIVHILFSGSGYEPAVTIPAIHGVDAVVDLISKFLAVALDNISSHSSRNLD